MNRSDRVVAITGASSGIGRATAERFGAKGWRVGLIARSAANLDATRKAIVVSGGTAHVAVADVTDSGRLAEAADAIEQALGPIDVWVNCAGVFVMGRFLDSTEHDVRRVTDVNYLGSISGIRIALERMMPRNRGTIVQVTSAAGYRGWPMQSFYSGSKWALRGFVEAVRSELLHDRSAVRLVMVHPPSTNSPLFNHLTLRAPKPMSPVTPIYQPEVTADAIYHAAMTGRRDMGVAFTTPMIAVANFLAPGLVDILAARIGVTGQQTDLDAVTVSDPNLDEPGQRDGSIHGPFGHLSRDRSVQLWASKNAWPLRAAVGASVLAGLEGWHRIRRRRMMPGQNRKNRVREGSKT